MALLLIFAVALARQKQPPAYFEANALRSSIELACEDIQDILDQYTQFATSNDPDSLADRTLHRPELLNPDSEDPNISQFHLEAHAARRFINRMTAKITDPSLDVRELEQFLEVADQRCSNLKLSWIDARRAAKRLGP